MRKIVITFILMLNTVLIYSQPLGKLERKSFQNKLTTTAEILNRKVKKGDLNKLPDLAFVYNRLHRKSDADSCYKKAHQLNKINRTEHIRDYIDLCKELQQDTNWYISYLPVLEQRGFKNVPVDDRGLMNLQTNPLCFNTPADEFGYSQVAGMEIVSSTYFKLNLEYENSIVKTYQVDSGCRLLPIPVNQLPVTNSNYHQGPIDVSSDKRLIFVTVSRNRKNEDDVHRLKIQFAFKETPETYSLFSDLPFNSEEYSVQHPSFHETTQTLFFASDMRGGAGGFDIYKTKYENGGWSKPEPLSKINTAANEVFPYVDEEENLYYSSKPVNGFGGLDLLCLKMGASEPFLLPEPLNSNFDDFGFSKQGPATGFFVSNRKGGKGGDDVYSFARDTTPYLVRVHVYDSLTKIPLVGARFQPIMSEWKPTQTNDSGMVLFTFPAERFGTSTNQMFSFAIEGYLNAGGGFKHLFGKNKILNVYCPMSQPARKLKIGDDLAKILALNPIYFDLDKSNIRPDAALELDKVVAIMKEYPTLEIELGSHTDSRASFGYNMKLSNRRANSSAEYIIANGIEKERLTQFGFGETRLLNECKDGVKCTSEQHSLNRRTEFIIKKL